MKYFALLQLFAFSCLQRFVAQNLQAMTSETAVQLQHLIQQHAELASSVPPSNLQAFLSQCFLDARYTLTVARIFKSWMPVIMATIVDACTIATPQEMLDHVTFALSKVLPMYPQEAFKAVCAHLKRGAPLLDRLLTQSKTQNRENCLELIKAAFRLLRAAPHEFSKWNWAPFFTLVQHNDEEIKWYAVTCVSILLEFDELFGKSLQDKVKLERQMVETEHVHLQQKLAFFNNVGNHDASVAPSKVEPKQPVQSVTQVCGIWLPRKANKTEIAKQVSPLVYTKTTTENMRSLALAVSQNRPILLEGITGSGKTALVEEVAKLTNNHDLIKVNLDESFDSKDLLGTYVCTDVPGEFKWQPGALTRAVLEGRWILIEDIDLAPFDIISTLIPLVESNNLFIPSRDELIPAAPGFQLFSTQSLIETFTGAAGRQRAVPMANLWYKVTVEKLPSEEIKLVFNEKYPALKPMIPKFIETYETLRRTAVPTATNEEEAAAKVEKDHQDFAQLRNFGRFFSFRDLLKFGQRVEQFHSKKIKGEFISMQIKEDIFHDAIDCFCGMIVKRSVFEAVIRKIAQVWQLDIDRVDHFMSSYKPKVTETSGSISIGRVTLPKEQNIAQETKSKQRFAHTKQSLQLLEQIAVSVQMIEPVLLTGETGTGKTSIVSHLASLMGRKLVVHNLNQQTDSADFIGGFKPVDAKVLALGILNHFEKLFPLTFSVKSNGEFLSKVKEHFEKRNWKGFGTLVAAVIEKAKDMCAPKEKTTKEDFDDRVPSEEKTPTKQRKIDNQAKLLKHWTLLEEAAIKFNKQQQQVKNSFAFSFAEGSLVKALKEGHWILLDEINLASTETLERLSGLLEGAQGTLFITEKGDTEPVKRHANFRLFACMNPPTDIGKKNLPPALRNRFTEFYVNELLDKDDLKIVVTQYLQRFMAHPPIEAIVTFYLEARKLSEVSLNDGANQRPHYSLRTLARSLEYVGTMLPLYGLDRSLYESFCMGFLTQLSRASYPMMEGLIKKCFLANKNTSILSQIVSKPGEEFVQFEHFWLKSGPCKQETPSHFILTSSVKEHLKNLARIVMAGKYPILLQGPTSAGKTSMVNYLAKRTGHRFVRINNHESTDVQEYLGSYITNSEGKLVFKEGILVEAVRNGYWIVLDELNLAPSDILEALNRLLDDNRELFIPETQETIKPHPHFQLFATQNPPGAYGGRKMLSRAFRNRFQELHIDDIPGPELETILQQRCGIPSSYAKKLVAVMKDLQVHRQSSKIFAGKHGFITPRDLFRWAERNPSTNAELAQIGYCLLAERLRRDDEKLIVKQTLEKHMKVELNIDAMYSCDKLPEFKQAVEAMSSPDFHFAKIIWTKTMKRLFFLVGECLKNKEPILLVGETGCGKTTICQLYSHIWKRQLHILNCHQHTEPSDFLGSLRPVRGRDQLTAKLKKLIQDFVAELKTYDNAVMIAKFANIDLDNIAASMRAIDACMQAQDGSSDNVEMKDANHTLEDLYASIQKMHAEWKALFVWYDGPLVQSMKQGDMFLIDEISLAEDAVLERLNSVLEPDRTLVLAEKGSEIIEEIVGHENFRVMATMNPGGDFGKRELSPALRNRFTEVYVPSLSVKEDLAIIVADRLHADLKLEYSNKMVLFVDYFKEQKTKRILSIRDLISWVDFCNMGYSKLHMSPNEAFLHGAEAVILEGVGIGVDTSEKARTSLRKMCVNFLLHQTPEKERLVLAAKFSVEKHAPTVEHVSPYVVQNMFGFAPFYVLRGTHPIPTALQYSLDAPTTRRNVTKVLRAMQLPKPLLLEGSPGVGKTSLIQAIAKAGGHNIVRINLSEQTDIMDLLGTDLPVEGSTGGEFQWSDGIFLRALKAGDWVLLDELNLASQSVLEGLNSVLDHRAEIFIPELNKTFQCPPTFRIFACQNPLQQGGGRKGLPKSFLNRFTQIYVEEFTSDDLLFIAMAMHGDIGEEKLRKMIAFNDLMHLRTMVEFKFGRKGSPWEFNLRDVFRWCELLKSDNKFGDKFFEYQPQKYIDLVYRQRMRTDEDKDCVSKLFEQVFGTPYVFNKYPSYTLAPTFVQVGSSVLNRNAIPKNHESMNNLHLLHCFLNPLESVLKCIEMNYMCILTGVAAAGKTSLVRLVAQLTGNVMHEFSMSSSTDTVELLGGFEQVDPLQKRKKIASAIKNHIDYVSKVALHHHASKENVSKIQQLYNSWAAFCSKEKLVKSEYNVGSNDEHEYLNMMEHLIEEVDVLCKSIDILFEQKDAILAQIKRVDKLVKEGVKGRFEWNDGVLIKSLEAGHWILIDNVNFCNPTVLDRLNSLLEPGGVLVVNERGLVDGEIKIVKPHPNFRIFMCMNPTFGEVSRAMRNRGIEICLSGFPIPSQDALALLSGIGVPSSLLNNALMHFHSQYVAKIHNEHEKPTIRDLIRCADIICAEVREGTNVLKAISEALDKVYIRGRCTMDLHRQIAIGLLHQVLQSVHDIHAEANFPSAYVLENAFLTTDTDFRTLLREGAYVYDTIKILVQTRTNKKSVDKSSLEHLEYALKYFVDMDAPATSAMRKLWLERMLKEAHSANDVVAMIQQALYILEKRRSSSVYASILASRSKLPSALSTMMQYQPIDSRLNASYHELIKYQTSMPVSDQDLLDKLAIVSERLPHIYQEMSYLAAMKHGDVLPSNSSLVMQSYYFYLNPQRAAQAATDIIPKLYYLFQGIEQILDAITSADADRSLSIHAKDLVLHRDRLWQYCFKHQQLASEYLVYWNWLLKSMKSYEHMKQVQPFNNVFLFIADLNQITNKFFDNMGRKNNLWKNSGKPKLSDAQHVKTLREQLSQSASKLETVFDKEAREVLLKGLCTLEWMVATNDASQELQKSISEIPAKLDTMIANPKQADLSAKQNQEQELDAIFHEVAEIDISNRHSAAKSVNWKTHSADALVSLFDHTSAQAEQEIIVILVQLAFAVKRNAPIEEQKNMLSAAVTKSQKLINLVLLKSSRPVTDMIPYQTLCWKFGTLVGVKPTDITSNVPWLMHDMVTRWNARLWKNSFNEMTDNNVLAKVGGPARLYQDIRSFKVASLLREWHLVPIRARYAKMDQMKHVVEFLAIHGVSTVVQEDVDWSYAFYTFANALNCFERSFSSAQFANILQFLSNLQNHTALQEDAFESFRASLAESSDERLKNSSSTAFTIALLLNQSADKTQFLLRGKMWSLLGVFLLELIIPGQPIDPALKYSLSLEHLQPQIAQINDQLIVYRQIEGFITGSSSNLFIEQLQAEKVQVEESIKKLEKKVVKRPATVLFRELYREMKQFIATMIDKNKLQSLVDMLSQHAAKENPQQAEIDSIMVKEDVWQHNAYQFVNKLSQRYPGYDDIIMPFVTCVYYVKYGLRLQTHSTILTSVSKSSRLYKLLGDITRTLLRYPSPNSITSLKVQAELVHEMLNEPNTKIFSKYDKYEAALKILKVLLSKIHLHVTHSQEVSKESVQLLDAVFAIYSRVWAEVKDELEAKKKEDENLYKYKEKTTVIENDDQIIDKEISKMFPSFADEYAQFNVQQQGKSVDEKLPMSSAEKVFAIAESHEELKYMIGVQRDVFGMNVSQKENLRTYIFDDSFQAASHLMTRLHSLEDTSSHYLSLLMYATKSLEQLSERINSRKVKLHNVYDSYNEPNVSEMTVAFNVVHDLVVRMRQLLNKYEEHPTLIQVIQVAEHILNKSVTSPVMKILTGIEILLKKSIEWEEFITSTAGTVKPQIEKLTSLVIRWRRMELENWRCIFDNKAKQMEVKSQHLWFQLYRIICLSTYNVDNTANTKFNPISGQFFAVCDEIIRGSSYGEFKVRITLLDTFCSQIAKEMSVPDFIRDNMTNEVREKFRNILYNMKRYYGQFVEKLDRIVADEVKPLESKLNDFLKLVKWEDVNYESLKSSALKSQRRLATFSSDYGIILAKSARELWDNHTIAIQTDEATSVKDKKKKRKAKQQVQQNFDAVLVSDMKKLASSFTVAAASTDEKLGGIEKTMHRIIEKHIVAGHVAQECNTIVPYLEEIAEEVIVQAQQLREKEALKTIKKRALLSLLSELKELGISHRAKTLEDVLNSQNVFEQPPLEFSSANASLQETWQKADTYYYKNLHLTQKLKLAMLDVNPDINKSEVNRMKGYSDNLLAIMLLHRSAFAKFAQHEAALKDMLAMFNGIARATGVAVHQDESKKSILKLKRFVDEFSELLEQQSILLVSLQKNLKMVSNLDHVSKSVAAIQTAKSIVDGVYFESLHSLLTIEQVQAVISACNSLKQSNTLFVQVLNTEFAPKSNELDELIQRGSLLCDEVVAVLNRAKVTPSTTTSSAHMDEMNAAIDAIVLKVQLSVQHLKEENDVLGKEKDEVEAKAREDAQREREKDIEKNQEKDKPEQPIAELSTFYNKENGVARLKIHFENVFKAANIRSITDKMRELIKFAHGFADNGSIKPDEKAFLFNALIAKLAALLPIVQHLFNTLQVYKLPFLSFHKSIAKLDYILLNTFITLLKEGFCEKQEGDGEGQEGETQFSHGTGMDDGEGEENVEDQMENEDQLLNQKDSKPQQKKKDDDDDDEEDNAIEMDQDFAADMEDMDKQDKDESDEEQEEENMEKDMGEIDDNDPNKETLDKKLWDEEQDEEDREENNDGNSNSHDQEQAEMQAKDMDDDDSDEKDNKKQEPRNKPKQQAPPESMPQQDEEEVQQEEYEDKVAPMQEDDEQPQDKKQQEEQEFQLPADLDLNDDMGDEEEQDDQEGDDEEEEDANERAPKPEQQQQQQNDDEQVDTDALEQDDQDVAEEDQDEEKDDSMAGLESAGQEKDPMQQDEDQDQQDDEQQNEDDEDKTNNKMDDQDAFEELKETPFGVNQTAGQASEIKNNDQGGDDAKEKEINTGEDKGNDVNKQDVGQSWEDKKSEQAQQKEAQKQFDPNPYRNLGDAIKKWKEKLKMIEQKKEQAEKAKTEGDAEEKDAEAYEFMKEDEEDPNEQQTLASATEEQSAAFPQMDMNKEEEDEEEPEEDKNKGWEDEQGEDKEEDDDSKDQKGKSSQPKNVSKFDKPAMDDAMDVDEDDEEADVASKPATNTQTSEDLLTDSTIHTRDSTTINQEEVDEELVKKPDLTMDDIKKMREEMETNLADWRVSTDTNNQSKDKWKEYEMMTSSLSQELCEQLRLILEPTLATKLKGDYKTGKRINMKKVIPYIASQYRKDKIWLRRTKPNKRQYQVLVSIDDSMSMANNNAGHMACAAVALLCKALAQLEVGQLSVISFGEKINLLHPFDKPFTDEAGSDILGQFTFNQKQTQMASFMDQAVQILDAYRSMELASTTEQMQICFIISDGRILDRDVIVRKVREAHDKKQLFVFILIDNPNPKESVLEMKSVSYDHQKKMNITSYMDQFPFPYYIILRDIQQLPGILADALRQWFELMNMLSAEH